MSVLANAVEGLEFVESARVHAGQILVVPTEAGWETLAHQGKTGLIRELSDLLSSAVDAGARWRFVRRLPPAGKAGRDRPLHPRWEELDRTAATWLGEAAVTGDLAVLEGHFPSEPIVPGLAQLLWADTLSRRFFAGYTTTAEIRNLKFAQVVVPGVRLRIALVHEFRARSRAVFRFTSDAGTHSSGVLIGA